MNKLTVRDIEVAGRRVLVRVDFNVSLDKDTGQILDDFRIRATLDTIRYLREGKAKVILCSHLGRPKTKADFRHLRLALVAERLSKLIGATVPVAPDCIGPEVERLVSQLRDGDVLLLENLRFHAGEQANDPEFAHLLAKLADVYVNDAFATAHRNHASVVGVPGLMPVAVAGLLVEREMQYLRRLISDFERPYGAIFGGAKISDKIGILSHFLRKANVLVLGGGMANTFMKAQGYEVGNSLVEDASLDHARQIIQEAKDYKVRFVLPTDVVVASYRKEGTAKAAEIDEATAKVIDIDKVQVEKGWSILDIGPRTVEHFTRELEQCKIIIWNGPMGKFEIPTFAEGSRKLADAIGKINALRVAGGGDTSALHRVPDLAKNFDYVSTGGDAFLRFVEGRELPGIAELTDR